MKLLTGAGQQGLGYIKRSVENASDEQKQPVLMGIAVYEQLFRGVEAEVESVAVGATIKTDGEIRFSKQVLFQESGKVAPILSELKPTPYDFFAGFPQIPYVCAFGFELPSASFGPMMEMSASLMKSMPQLYGLEPEQVDKMMELSKEKFSDMQGMSFLWGVGQPGASIYSGMMGSIRVGDATTYVKRYLEFWEELKLGIGAAKGSLFDKMSVQSIEIDGKPAFKLTMQIPGMFGASGQRSEKIEAEMKKIFGPDGNVTAYFAAGDARTVLFSYTDDTLLRQGLRAMENQDDLSHEASLVRTRERLPMEVLGTGYWSPSGTTAYAQRLVELMVDAESKPRIPEFPATPPVGWTVKVSPPRKFDAEMVVPHEFLVALAEYIDDVKQMFAETAAN